MDYQNTIQYTDTAPDHSAANDMLEWLATQVDYLGGRILPPRWPDLANWRVQAFFEDAPDEGPLPDGCRRVMTPMRMLEGVSS